MMLHENTRSLVRSYDDTDFFDIKAGGVLTHLRPLSIIIILFIIILDYVLKISVDKHHNLSFTLKIGCQRGIPLKMTDVDYADDYDL